MGHYDEFSLTTRLFLKAYPWRRIDPVPWSPLPRPLSQCRLALVSTAGLVPPGAAPFDEGVRGGDWSFREIPETIQVRDLREFHRSESFDHRGLQADPNLGFPIDRLRELVRQGRLGSLNHRHFSFMGSITAPGRLQRESAPETARRLHADGVEAALLVPV